MGDSLEPGVDVPENAVFFDSIFADESGKPYKKPRTVGLYERDGGLLWKHVDMDSGQNQSRHARELVLTFITTVGNYDYGFNWIFRMDGTLEMEVMLTGIMQVKGVEASAASKQSPALGDAIRSQSDECSGFLSEPIAGWPRSAGVGSGEPFP
jgi:primary-amine oxidase